MILKEHPGMPAAAAARCSTTGRAHPGIGLKFRKPFYDKAAD